MESIEWALLRRLIERNKSGSAALKYYRSKDGFVDSVSICDFSLPVRAEHVTTVAGESRDWYRDSYVCNAGFLNGYIPLRDNPWLYDEEKGEWKSTPMRGAMETIKQLVSQGCVKRTDEIEEFVKYGRYAL